MTSHHRKLLLTEHINKTLKDEVSSESICPPPPPPPSPPPPPPPPNHRIALIICLSVAAAFVIISYFAIRRFRSRRRTQPQNSNLREDFVDELQGPVIDHPIWYIRTIGLPQSVIDSIAMIQYKKGEKLIEGSDCAVCLSEFEENESLRVLPICRHGFHMECIDTWLRDHKNCPVCRAAVVIGDASQVSLEETSLSESGASEEEQVEIDGEMVDQSDEIMDRRRLRVVSDLGGNRVKLDQEMESARRSISLDLSSAPPF